MLLNISKVLYIGFIFYLGLISEVFTVIPGMSLFLGSSMLLLLFISKILSKKNNTIVIPKTFVCLIIFTLVSLFTGIFVAVDSSHLVNSILTYVQILGLIFYIVNVSKTDQTTDFFVNSYMVFALVYGIYMLGWGHIRLDGRLTLAFETNPNNAARILLYGMGFNLVQMKIKSIKSLLMGLVSASFFTYLIIETGSRKAFYSAIILLILWLILVFKDYWQSYSSVKKIGVLLVSLTMISIVVYNFFDIFVDSSIYTRLLEKGTGLTDDPIRVGMYKEAYSFFSSHPFFGIGFNQFRNLSIYGTYSHSTYGELLATTGFIGTFLYLLSYGLIIIDLLRIRFKETNQKISIQSTMYIIIFIIMLILGTGIIHFYGIIDNIIIAIIISFIILNKDVMKKHIN